MKLSVLVRWNLSFDELNSIWRNNDLELSELCEACEL